MIRAKGRYQNQVLQLDRPLGLPEGAEVSVDIHPIERIQDLEHQSWIQVGMNRLEDEWDNPEDAVYDDWKRLYGVAGALLKTTTLCYKGICD